MQGSSKFHKHILTASHVFQQQHDFKMSKQKSLTPLLQLIEFIIP